MLRTISAMASELELTPQQFRELVAIALDLVTAHLASIPDQPLDGTAGDPAGSAALARSLREPLPERGADARAVLADLMERVVPHSFTTVSPGFMAYVPGGGLPHAAVADLVADIVNRYVTVWRAAPGLAQIEATVARWLCDIVGYPADALGTLTTGGSLANLSAIVTARRARLGDDDFRDAVIYISDQTHHSVGKAAVQVGFAPRQLRELPTDAEFRLAPASLARAVREDRAAGRRPLLVIASAGTTNTGAVDDLGGLADVAAAERLWLHVDAAYGGFFLLTERGRAVMQGIDRADSVTLDPHKGMFLPYGTGAVLVREGADLRWAFGGTSIYLPEAVDDPAAVNASDISPELSRDFRALRLWLPLKMHGSAPFRRQLDEKIDLARWAADQLRQVPGIELVAEPQLSTLAFRLVRPGMDEPALTRLNRDLLDRINARQRVLLSPTMLGERFVIRICIVSFRTHADRVAEAVAIVRDVVREPAGSPA
jgi:aromatic-L-amino-acid decarboxylase